MISDVVISPFRVFAQYLPYQDTIKQLGLRIQELWNQLLNVICGWRISKPPMFQMERYNDNLSSFDAKINLLRFYGYPINSNLKEVESLPRQKLYAPPISKLPLPLYLDYCQKAASYAEFLYFCKTNPQEVLAIKKDFLQQALFSRSAIPQNHIVRRSGFAEVYGYGHAITQELYGSYMEAAIVMTCDRIPTWTFDRILLNLSYLRSVIADNMPYASNAPFFGVPIDAQMTHLYSIESDPITRKYIKTYLNSHYSPLTLFFEHARGSAGIREVPIQSLQLQQIVKTVIEKALGIFVPLNGEEINIGTAIYFRNMPLEHLSPSDLQAISLWVNQEQTPVFWHMPQQDIPKVRVHVQNLYTTALQTHDKNEILRLCGEIFWWLTVSKLFHRGDPSIAEVLFKSILRYKNIPISAWKENLIPWCEAIKHFTPQDFAKYFPTLFEVLP